MPFSQLLMRQSEAQTLTFFKRAIKVFLIVMKSRSDEDKIGISFKKMDVKKMREFEVNKQFHHSRMASYLIYHNLRAFKSVIC